MIDPEEIAEKSEQLGVHSANVQRDYVFGWLLSGLYQPDNPSRELLILKGGNGFRKAYFPNARFSNDLDFSTETAVDVARLRAGLDAACMYGQERSGIQFKLDSTRIEPKHLVDKDLQAYEARIYFKNFNDEGEIVIKVKLDITEFDRIYLPIQPRSLIHDYSDADQCRATIRCTKLEELLASKMKALLQREHSPDLYDFVHAIFFQKQLDIRRIEVITTFLRKTVFEPTPTVAKNLFLALPFQAFGSLWNQYLVCPAMATFSCEDAEGWFRTVINEPFGLLTLPAAAMAGGLNVPSHVAAKFRDIIMEAGRLSRILRVGYSGIERRVEPYSLAYKRRKDGVAQEYFYVWDLTGGQSSGPGIKSFIAGDVQSVAMTQETFQPRYPIELTKDATVSGYFGRPSFSSKPSASTWKERPARWTKKPSMWGVEHRVQCPFCGKIFKRDGFDITLNRHKDKFDNECMGRMGTIL